MELMNIDHLEVGATSREPDKVPKARGKACMRCRSRKTKCEWVGGVCQACIASGTQANCSTTSEPASTTQGATRRAHAHSSRIPNSVMVQDQPVCAANVEKPKIVSRKRTRSESTPSDVQSGSAGSCQRPRISIQDTSTENSSSRGSTTMTRSTLEPISEFDELDELELEPSAIDYNLFQASQNIISTLSRSRNNVSELVDMSETAMGSGSEESSDDDSLLYGASGKKRQQAMTKSARKRKGPIKNRKAPSDTVVEHDPSTCGKLF
jgi:hypothetical protein